MPFQSLARAQSGTTRSRALAQLPMTIASPAAAAKARGPRKTVQQQSSFATVVKKRAKKRAQVSRARLGVAADAPKHGRLRMHGPRNVATDDDDARRSLAEKTQRRTVHLNAVLASGTADFEAAPSRASFADGEMGALLHEERFNDYVDGNFDDAGAEVRSLDQRDRKVGLFGDWLEASGYGKYIEWVQDGKGEFRPRCI